MPSFPIQAVLFARDRMTAVARRAFRRIEREGQKTARRTSKAFRFRDMVGAGLAVDAFQGMTSRVTQAAQRVVEFENVLQGISTQAGLSAAETNKLRAEVVGISGETGVTKDELAAMADTIVNLEGAAGFSVDKLRLLAKTQIATKAEARDLAEVQFALNQAFFEGKASAEQLEPALSAVITAGKNGSIPLAEMATVLQQNAASFSDFAKSGTEGAAQLAAALQAMRTEGFGSASEAGTGLAAFLGKLINDSDKLRKMGVQVFRKVNGKNELRAIDDILGQITEKTHGGDLSRLSKMFRDKEAFKAIRGLIVQRQKYDELVTSARGANAVQEDFEKNLNSTTGQLQLAETQMRNLVESFITPELLQSVTAGLQGMLTVVEGIAKGIAAVADSVGDLLIELGAVDERIANITGADQLLLSQARGFRRGEVHTQQAALLDRRGVAPEDTRLAAADAILRKAEAQGLIQPGQEVNVHEVAAKVARQLGLDEGFIGGLLQPSDEREQIRRQASEVALGIFEAQRERDFAEQQQLGQEMLREQRRTNRLLAQRAPANGTPALGGGSRP